MEKSSSGDFIKRDLEDIEKCGVLIAYMPRLSAGTCMELFSAKLKEKKTICICSLKKPKSMDNSTFRYGHQENRRTRKHTQNDSTTQLYT